MKIAIVGAGSVYTPELIEKLASVRDRFPVSEIVLMDVDPERLRVMEGFCRRYMAHLGFSPELKATTDLDKAVYGAAFVSTQIRVGLNHCRVLDEKIPLSHGLIGQETTGAGGFAKALRTIPQMLEIARSVEKNTDNAWIINYTNPTGIVAEAVNRYTKARIVGLCAGGLNIRYLAQSALHIDPQRVHFDIAGLNHLSFSYNIYIDNRPVTPEEFDVLANAVGCVDPELIKAIGAVPIGYLQYYFHTGKKVRELQQAPQTRGEQVLELEKEIYEQFADPACHDKPEALWKRGGGGYSDVAIGVMDALYNGTTLQTVGNIPNRGTLPFLDDDAVIETPILVDRSGIRGVKVGEPPKAVQGLIKAVKAYEQLTVEAAHTGDRMTAVMALTMHPLVKDYDLAKILVDEILAAHPQYLGYFHG